MEILRFFFRIVIWLPFLLLFTESRAQLTMQDSITLSEKIRPVQGIQPVVPLKTYFYNCITNQEKIPCDYVLHEILDHGAVLKQILNDVNKKSLSDCSFRDIGRGKHEFVCSFYTSIDYAAIQFKAVESHFKKKDGYLGT